MFSGCSFLVPFISQYVAPASEGKLARLALASIEEAWHLLFNLFPVASILFFQHNYINICNTFTGPNISYNRSSVTIALQEDPKTIAQIWRSINRLVHSYPPSFSIRI